MGVLIVGGGLFGQVIASRLREDGHQVTVFDRREPEAGSPPSGGHLKPSWLTAIPKKDLEGSLETLDRLYGVQKLDCQFLAKKVELLRVDVDTVLSGPVIEANVIEAGNGMLKYTVDGIQGVTHYQKGTIIVAAGIWSAELLPEFKYRISAKKGMSFTFSGVSETIPNIIRPWAPYKQIVRTYHGPGKIWIGDGTAIKPYNWNEETEMRIKKRVLQYLPEVGFQELVARRGIRPYMTDGLQRVGDRLWLATGGGKSGMALAGVYANTLAKSLS